MPNVRPVSETGHAVRSVIVRVYAIAGQEMFTKLMPLMNVSAQVTDLYSSQVRW